MTTSDKTEAQTTELSKDTAGAETFETRAESECEKGNISEDRIIEGISSENKKIQTSGIY